MGSADDCYDNAVIESFWAQVKTELLSHHRWKVAHQARNALSESLTSSTTAATTQR